MKPEQYIARLEHLETERQNWDDHWQEIAEVVFPRRADFNRSMYKGERKNTKIVDSTAVIANELLGAGLHGMLTNHAPCCVLLTYERALLGYDSLRYWLYVYRGRP